MDGTTYNRRQVLTGGLAGLGALLVEPSFEGKARSHEIRLPSGDPTSEIWS